MTSMEDLVWPENASATADRDRFDAQVMALLGDAAYIAFAPYPGPAPWEADWEQVPLQGGLDVVPLVGGGVAWVCPFGAAQTALRPVFVARPEALSILSFQMKPDAATIQAALKAADGRPADRVLVFDDGVLMDIRTGQPDD